MKYIEHIIDERGVCTITLKREPVNALSFELLFSLKNIFVSLEGNNDVRVVIITSSLNHFSAGADLKERKIMSVKDSKEALDNFNDCFNTIESFKHPILCIIDGYCLGGGAELALACDLRIGTPKTIIGFPETSIGIIPGAGGTYRLPKTIGYSNAKYWILTGEKFNALSSFDYGFLDFIFEKEVIFQETYKIVEKILSNAPIAVSSAKLSINNSFNKNRSDGLNIERKNYEVALNTKDRNEALDAFVNKRKPIWKNK